MAFVLPTFNLNVGIWSGSSTPGAGTPRVSTTGQLRPPNSGAAWYSPILGGVSTMVLLLPPGTDIRDAYQTGASSDWVEVPIGSGRIYRVVIADDIGKGFTNEHRFAIVFKTSGYLWPIPMP